MPLPGALPTGVLAGSVEWKRIEDVGIWYGMPWLSDDLLTKLTPNYDGACIIANTASSIMLLPTRDRSRFRYTRPMSEHSFIYIVKAQGAKQATENIVEVNPVACFLR